MVVKKAIKMKIFLSYILIGILLLLVFAAIIDNIVYNMGKEQIQESVNKNLDSVYNAGQLMLGSLYKYMYNLYNEDHVIVNALYSKEFDRFEMYNIHKRLDDILNASPILDSVYIYNRKANLVFSSISSAQPLDFFYEEGILDLINNSIKNKENLFIPRRVTLRNLNNSYLRSFDENVITIVFSYGKTGETPQEAMIVNISQSNLQKVINQNYLPGGSIDTFIINQNGDILTHKDPTMLNKNLKEQAYIEKIYSYDSKGSFDTTISEESCIISYIKSTNWGLTYIGIARYDDILGNIKNIRMIIIFLTIVFVMIGLMGILYFTKIIYSPLNGLVREVSGLNYTLSKNYPNEYKFVSSSIESMGNKINELQQKVSNYFPAKKNNLLKRLLNGNLIIDSNSMNLLKSNDICLQGPKFIVVVFRIDSFYKISNNNMINKLELYRDTLTEATAEFFADKFELEIVHDNLESISIILNLPTEKDSFIAEITNIINKIQEVFYNEFQLTFTAGLGSIVPSINDLKTTYLDAIEYTNYRIIYGKSSIITQKDIHVLHKQVYQYPYKIEKKIIDNLKLAHKDELEVLLAEFSNSVRNYGYSEIILSYSQLVLMIIRTAKKMLGTLTEDLRISYLNIQSNLKYCDIFTEIQELIISILFKIIDERDAKVSDKNFIIVNKVKQYIDDSFSDEALTVEMLADQVELSANYLRNIFKSITGISLSNYILQKRFEEAKKLLIETDYTAKKISSMVGFQNSDYFYYAFKKYTGKSASNYRRENENIDLEN